MTTTARRQTNLRVVERMLDALDIVRRDDVVRYLGIGRKPASDLLSDLGAAGKCTLVGFGPRAGWARPDKAPALQAEYESRRRPRPERAMGPCDAEFDAEKPPRRKWVSAADCPTPQVRLNSVWALAL